MRTGGSSRGAMNRSFPSLVLCVVILAVLIPRGIGAQDVMPTFRRSGTGFGTGITVSAVALAAALSSGDGNACTGSGDYLRVCRVVFLGGTALGGGAGAIIGAL